MTRQLNTERTAETSTFTNFGLQGGRHSCCVIISGAAFDIPFDFCFYVDCKGYILTKQIKDWIKNHLMVLPPLRYWNPRNGRIYTCMNSKATTSFNRRSRLYSSQLDQQQKYLHLFSFQTCLLTSRSDIEINRVARRGLLMEILPETTMRLTCPTAPPAFITVCLFRAGFVLTNLRRLK